jgi:hypothetical protein
MAALDLGACEVCGAPATCLAVDEVELEPDWESGYRRFAPGHSHARCAGHQTRPRTFWQDGRVTEVKPVGRP